MKNLNKLLTLLTFLAIALMTLSMFVEAKAAEKAPEPFQNSSIERKLENGKVQKFDGNQYMIVPRQKAKVKPVAKTSPAPAPKTIVKKVPHPKNRVTIYGGMGPDDIELNTGGDSARLEREAQLGIGYSRRITERVHVDVIIISNETYMGGVGVNF